MMQYFKCDDIGELKDYVGCKFDRAQQGKCLKMTQPVIIQSFKDEFGIGLNKNIKIPEVPSKMSMKSDVNNEMDAVGQRQY